ncbi:MAG: type II toxin-antitoxin system HicB family antitoxin [Chloroflexota bacterium]|jgi:predicted RNase H-like HicB family nuclease|nr:type II toxin-antitoxin system HicB family antitoxin [Chloroflexota bacterium]
MYAIQLRLEYNEDSDMYTITSPDVPGLVTEGSTPEEISHNVQEALTGLLEVWAALKMPLPPALERARAQMPKTADLLVMA